MRRLRLPIIVEAEGHDVAGIEPLRTPRDHPRRRIDVMSWLPDRIGRMSRTLTLAFVIATVPAYRVNAQYFGYGYGFPGYGYGAGMPFSGYGYGYGLPGYGFGAYGPPSMAYGYGLGYPGYGYGGAGYYGGPGVGVGGPGLYGVGAPFGATGPGSFNPYFGLGLTPLGVESALTERYLLGRGTAAYSTRPGTVPPATITPGTGAPRP
jgi:hypothetical protein